MKWHIIHSHNCDFLIEVYGENEGQSSEDIQISNKTQSSSFDEHWHTCIIEFGLPSVEFKEAVRQLRKSESVDGMLPV
ncbi:hypothetical protein MAR_017812 [Mya arenaria]|uniref:Uncharacterized protein n=1 Tax=Mya arenaria TaxID=6604 RepID=A0ABY7EFJ6_MYAAR|nr:hypothetical protein MAR_017812 [Mya arenaria]